MEIKKRFLFFILAVLAMCACSEKEKPKEPGTGYLTLNISQAAILKSGVEIADFTMSISDGRTNVLKERICDLSEQIALPVGSYTVELYSMEFSEPKFEMSFYYGKTNVEIEAGETQDAFLVCSQGNAGIKIAWSREFSEMYNTFHARIDCDNGYLHYSSAESRTGYFLPGTVSISIHADGQTIDGGKITLAAGDMVTTNLLSKYTQSGGLSIGISIDETVNNREIDLIVEPEYTTGTNSETNPYSVAQAIELQNKENDAWVIGYIVGSKPSSGYDFVNGTWQNTNIVIADNIAETDDNKCIFVELGTGTYRTNLSLVIDEGRLHRKVAIKGNLLAYQSRAGLRNITGYSYK